jgi:hypothetical protein
MIRFVCECGRYLQARDEDVGKKARCPACNEVMLVPDEGGSGRRARRGSAQDSKAWAGPARRDRREDEYFDDDDRRRDQAPARRPRRGAGEESSGKATAALVVGLASLCLPVVLPAIVALVLGILALRDIGRANGGLGGKGLALAGVGLSVLSLILTAAAGVPTAMYLANRGERQARATDGKNLQELARGLTSFAENNQARMPQAAAFRTRDGRPGLSWRVAILPYIGQERLFGQFRLDEAWDSAHNRQLVAQMPRAFLTPGAPDDGSGRTYYQVLVGKGAMFEVPEGQKGRPGGGTPEMGIRWPADVPDGIQNTILIATARSSVIWTQPDDLEFTRFGLLPPLGGHLTNGFHVALADGSVRWLPQNTPDQTLRALITRNGNEPISWP